MSAVGVDQRHTTRPGVLRARRRFGLSEQAWRAVRRFRQSPLSVAGLAIIVVMVAVAAVGPFLVPYPKDASGAIVFHAPVTVGSENDPLPVGEWKVNGVSRNPVFNYNPKLFWDGDPTHAKAKIPAGPNNPVGVAWIDLSKEHYGIHGTPEPSRIGYTESHGCIRLSNWDVMRLAAMVSPGTKVILR